MNDHYVIRTALFLLIITFSTQSLSKQKLLIVGEEIPPFKFIENNKVTGIEIEVASHIFTKMGVDFEFMLCPWKRCWRMLKSGEADVGMTVSKKIQREEYAYFPVNHVWISKFHFLTNTETKEKYDIKSVNDAIRWDLNIGIVNGNSYHELFWEKFPHQDQAKKNYHTLLKPVTTVEQNLLKLSKKRIDLFPISKEIGLHTAIKKLGLNNITYYDFEIFTKLYPNCFSKKSNYSSEKYPTIMLLMQAYDIELAKFKKSVEFQKIFDKYLGV